MFRRNDLSPPFLDGFEARLYRVRVLTERGRVVLRFALVRLSVDASDLSRLLVLVHSSGERYRAFVFPQIDLPVENCFIKSFCFLQIRSWNFKQHDFVFHFCLLVWIAHGAEALRLSTFTVPRESSMICQTDQRPFRNGVRRTSSSKASAPARRRTMPRTGGLPPVHW